MEGFVIREETHLDYLIEERRKLAIEKRRIDVTPYQKRLINRDYNDSTNQIINLMAVEQALGVTREHNKKAAL